MKCGAALAALVWRVLVVSSVFLFSSSSSTDGNEQPAWLVNEPEAWQQNVHSGVLVDARNNDTRVTQFANFADYNVMRVNGFTDGEIIDAVEHFFWGKIGGVAMELGALDGSLNSNSMTYDLEESFQWNRILIEGDPKYRPGMIKHSPKSFSVNGLICEDTAKMHFALSDYVGGVLEFMADEFMKTYHKEVYEAGTPPGNVSSVNWASIKSNVAELYCMPLQHVMHRAHVKHVNFFILDVEGGEMNVLKSIAWDHIVFDVLCIETEPSNRPEGYHQQITNFLGEYGYINYTGQIGRNICKY